MHGVFILHTIISSVARNGNTGRTSSQRTLYTIQQISIPPHCHFEHSEKSFSSPFSTTPSLSRLWEAPPTAFPAIRCFPFLAAKHAPSYCQRKRSLGSARDDDTGKMLSKHSLCRICWIRASLHTVISSVARNLFRPLFPSSFAKPFTGSTAPTFSRYGVSHFSLSGTLPLTANEKDPSTSLGMTIREECFLSTAFAGYIG